MAALRPVSRIILNRRESKKLIRLYNRGDLKWSDVALSKLKLMVRQVLRKEQGGMCLYCQRTIVVERRNAAEDIEHFLDKSRDAYKRYAFNATNLLLSCHACNFEKGTRDLGTPAIRAARYLLPPMGPFRWPHPYFDDMQAYIEKRRGPVYIPISDSGRRVQAINLIKDLKLNDIKNIESRHNFLTQRSMRITTLAGKAARIGGERNRRRIIFLMNEQERIQAELY